MAPLTWAWVWKKCCHNAQKSSGQLAPMPRDAELAERAVCSPIQAGKTNTLVIGVEMQGHVVTVEVGLFNTKKAPPAL